MARLTVLISGDPLPPRQTARIRLGIRHNLEKPVRELRISLNTSSGLQLMGKPTIFIPQLASGETAWSEIELRAERAADYRLLVERGSARQGFHAIDFEAVEVPIRVGTLGTFPLNELVLSGKPTPLKANERRRIRLRLHNNSDTPLETTHLYFSGEHIEVDAAGIVEISELPAKQGKEFEITLRPTVAGDITLKVDVSAWCPLGPVRQTYEVRLQVQATGASGISHGGGDSLTIVRNIYQTSDLPQSQQPGEQHMEIASGEDRLVIPLSRSSQANQSQRCPRCGRLIEDSRARYCDACSYEFPTGTHKQGG
jgi:hypothetical protein